MAAQRDMLEYQHPALPDPHALPAYGGSPYTPQVYMDHGYPAEQATDYYGAQQQAVYFDEKRAPSAMHASRRPSPMGSFEGGVSNADVERMYAAVPMKRKASDDISNYDIAPPQKRVASAQLQVQNPATYDNSGQTSPYSQYVATPMSSGSFQPGLTPGARMGHHYSTSNASQVSLAAPSPHTPAWSPSFATVKTEPSPPAPMTPVPRPASSSPVKSSAPRLVRTSTMQSGSPVAPTFNPIHTGNFNPYAMYPQKASLKLKGDLDSMTKNWTEDEINDRRRLVEFKRSQDGSNINADFKPVAPKDRQPTSITISCILWKEKKEYYVTSVDTIYLLEALVGVRFTVEEKNRIRRNLEGFRPATVSKSKQDSEEFFKVIMGFPHPKPRNIEKDVKVFPWKILAHALKKIISKYSASYSSTASAIMTPLPSSYAETMGEMGYPPSPPPPYTSQYVYEQAQYPPGMIPGRMSAPVTTAPVPELQLQVPTTGAGYDMMDSYNFATMPGMPQASMLLTPDAMSAPLRAPSWDYNQFVNDSPVTTAPNSAPAGVWVRPAIETADFVTPEHYR